MVIVNRTCNSAQMSYKEIFHTLKSNQVPQIEEEQTIQWSNEKKDKRTNNDQQSSTQKTID